MGTSVGETSRVPTMKVPRVRFTVWRLMVLVALIGLNLAAGVATSRFFPRPQLPHPVWIGNGRGYVSYLVEGQVEYGVGNAETGYKRTRVELLKPRPTLLRIWSPVIAGVGVSLLTLGLLARGRHRTLCHSAVGKTS